MGRWAGRQVWAKAGFVLGAKGWHGSARLYICVGSAAWASGIWVGRQRKEKDLASGSDRYMGSSRRVQSVWMDGFRLIWINGVGRLHSDWIFDIMVINYI